MTLAFETFSGGLSPEAVARLRISVFRDWPYLYDGTVEYELNYMTALAASTDSIVIVARDGDVVVGAATGMPLAYEHEAFTRPFVDRGFDVSKIFYCAESVLDSSYRGQGAGHVFFDLREKHAKRLHLEQSVFCAVLREDDHPQRQEEVGFLADFWRKRGYSPVAGLTTQFAWKDVGIDHETEKQMQFWMKEL